MKLSMDSLELGPKENAVAEIAWFVLGVVSFDEPRYGNSSKCRRQSTWWLLLERLRRKKLPRLDVLQGWWYLGAEVKLMKVIQKVYLKSINKTLQANSTQRKFRSQTSDNMDSDRWKSRGGKSQRREDKRREEKRRRKKIREEKESEERRCRRAKR